MIQFKKQLLGIAALATFLIIAVASSSSKTTNYNSGTTKKLPNELNLSQSVLLIERFKNEYHQEAAETYLKEKYPHKYKFVTKEDIFDGGETYDDTTLYKFGLTSKVVSYTLNPRSGERSKTSVNFIIYDRIQQISYAPIGKTSTNYWKSFKPALDYVLVNAR